MALEKLLCFLFEKQFNTVVKNKMFSTIQNYMATVLWQRRKLVLFYTIYITTSFYILFWCFISIFIVTMYIIAKQLNNEIYG